MRLKIVIILLALILLTNCSQHVVASTAPTLKRFDCNVTIETNNEGGLDAKNAYKLFRCYKSMKAYYEKRDATYNNIYIGKKL